MAEQADDGYMIWSDTYINKRFGNKCISKGTMSNITNLLSKNKPVTVYYIPQNCEYMIKNLDDFNSKLLPYLDPMSQKNGIKKQINEACFSSILRVRVFKNTCLTDSQTGSFFYSGATYASMFELLNIIADYIFNNKLEDAFRLSRLTPQKLKLQGLKQAYTY